MPRLLTLDSLCSLLDQTVLSPLGTTFVIASAWYQYRQSASQPINFTDFLAWYKGVDWKLRCLIVFVLLKTLNRALKRLVMNHGWAADVPRWEVGKEVVLVTGGCVGIGKAIVDALAPKSCPVAVLDLAPPTFTNPKAKYYKCDVTNPTQIAEVASLIRNDMGDPTVIVNNAGIARGKRIIELTNREFIGTLNVNVVGAHNMLREFLPSIIKKNHGHIVTLASGAAYFSIPQIADYNASKAGVLALHETLAIELTTRYNAPKVRTTVVCPLKVVTQMGSSMEEADNQFMTPTLTVEEVSDRVVGAIDSGLSQHIIMPAFASAAVPLVRALPDWFRALMHIAGKTSTTINDERRDSHIKASGYKILSDGTDDI